MDTQQIQELLNRVPGWEGRAHVVHALDGGITNRNLLIAVETEQFVLRLAGADTHLLEIDRSAELEAASRAAGLGIAPEVTAFLEPEGYLITRFVAGKSPSSTHIKEPSILAAICGHLRAFHDGIALANDFGAFEVPYLHRASALSRGVAIPDEFTSAAESASQIAAAFASSPEPKRPCHNDLLCANFLVDANNAHHVWLLDWEYAGNNDRYFDLGNLSVNNEFDESDRERLLRSYFGSVNARRSGRLELMMIMSDFREAMWAVVQQGISALDFDFREYSAKHFERMLSAATGRHFKALLANAAGGIPDA